MNIQLAELPYEVPATTLSLAEETFVQFLAVEGDVAMAYRAAYPGIIQGARKLGSQLARRPAIQARLRVHQEAITKIPSAKSAARLIYELEEMVDADPNELVRVTFKPCLGCWPSGVKNEMPNPDCLGCDGQGERRVELADTTTVSPGARRLFKGVELGPYGEIKKLLIHDQMAARVELHKLKGLHIDRSVNLNVNRNLPNVGELAKDPIAMEEYLESLK
jgi:hypothetical protein